MVNRRRRRMMVCSMAYGVLYPLSGGGMDGYEWREFRLQVVCFT